MIPDGKVRRQITLKRGTAEAVDVLAARLRLRQSEIYEAAVSWYWRGQIKGFMAGTAADRELARRLVKRDADAEQNLAAQVAADPPILRRARLAE